ncbi:MAG: GTPase, partial [Candidatus Zixiibacteriota bacterium]
MRLGIIGKPQCGKTTVFNAASGKEVAVGDFSKAVHRAAIKVPDIRLDNLAKLVSPQKITYAEIEFLDAPGFTGKGKASTGFEISQELQLMDAIILVINHFEPDAAPEKDIQDIIDEMILADQVMLEKIIKNKSKKMKLTGDKSAAWELNLLKKCQINLDNEIPLIDVDFTADEKKTLRGFNYLTLKPLLIVLNIGEDDISESENILRKFNDFATPDKREIASLCGKIEMELVNLNIEDRKIFMADLGISMPAVEQVIRKSYSLLGLISFFTIGKP